MENSLEKYKKLWTENIQQVAKKDNKQQEQIKVILQKKSANSIKILKSTFIKEAIVTILILLLVSCLLYINFYNASGLIIYCCTVVPIIISYLYFGKNILTLKNPDHDLMNSLKSNISQIKRGINFYYKSLILGFPILYFTAFLLIIIQENNLVLDTNNIIVLSLGALFSLLIPRPAKWLIDAFYSAHLEDLKANLSELKEEDSSKN